MNCGEKLKRTDHKRHAALSGVTITRRGNIKSTLYCVFTFLKGIKTEQGTEGENRGA